MAVQPDRALKPTGQFKKYKELYEREESIKKKVNKLNELPLICRVRCIQDPTLSGRLADNEVNKQMFGKICNIKEQWWNPLNHLYWIQRMLSSSIIF